MLSWWMLVHGKWQLAIRFHDASFFTFLAGLRAARASIFNKFWEGVSPLSPLLPFFLHQNSLAEVQTSKNLVKFCPGLEVISHSETIAPKNKVWQIRYSTVQTNELNASYYCLRSKIFKITSHKMKCLGSKRQISKKGSALTTHLQQSWH